MVPSTPSAPRSDGTTRRGASPAECRTVRSLRCGPATTDRGPSEVESSVPVGRSAARAPPPPRPWWQASGSLERRSRCAPCRTSGASPLPGLQRSTAARVATTSADGAAFAAKRLRVQHPCQPLGSFCAGHHKRNGHA